MHETKCPALEDGELVQQAREPHRTNSAESGRKSSETPPRERLPRYKVFGGCITLEHGIDFSMLWKYHVQLFHQVVEVLSEIKPNQAMKILYDLDTAKDKACEPCPCPWRESVSRQKAR